jgi:hypothetical protein
MTDNPQHDTQQREQVLAALQELAEAVGRLTARVDALEAKARAAAHCQL